MDDKTQIKIDMSLDDIIKLNKKEQRQAKKVKTGGDRGLGRGRRGRGAQGIPTGRGRGQQGAFSGRGQRGAFAGRGQRGAFAGRGQRGAFAGRGQRGAFAGRGQRGTFAGRGQRGVFAGRGQRGAFAGQGQQGAPRGGFSGRGRGKEKGGAASFTQTANRSSMRGVNKALVSRRGGGRGRGRGISLQKQAAMIAVSKPTSFQTVKNLRGIGRGRGNRGGSLQTKKGLVFTNSTNGQKRSQQLLKVRAQATLLREQQEAMKLLQQAQRNMQSINNAIQKTSRESVVNQRRGITTNQAPAGRGRGKLLAGLMNRTTSRSMQNLAQVSNSNRQMLNTSVTISNPRAGNKRRQWRANKSNAAPPNADVVLHVNNNRSGFGADVKPSFADQLKKLKPIQPTSYKFQKSMFAVPSTSISLNDRFSSSQTNLDSLPEDRKVFL